MAVKKAGEVEAVQIAPQVVPKSGIVEQPPKDEPKPVSTAPTEPTPVRGPTPVVERRPTVREQAIQNVRERERVLGRNRSNVVRSWFWNGVEHHELDDGSVAKSTAIGRTLSLGPLASSTALRLRPTVVAHNRGENPIQGIGDETRKSALSFVKDIGIEAATILIPGVWVKDWDRLSNRERALNAAMDLVIFVPVIGPAARVSTRASKAVIKTAIRAGSNTVEAAKVGRALNKIENAIILGDGQAIREATSIIRESARKAGVNLERITKEVNRKADDIADLGSHRKPLPTDALKRNLKEQNKIVVKIDNATKEIKPSIRREQVLDLGAGDRPAKGATHAIDALSKREILELRAGKNLPKDLDFKFGSDFTKELPFENAQFDRIVSNFALDTFGTKKTFEETIRILKNGGEIAVTVGDRQAVEFIKQALKRVGFKNIKIKPTDIGDDPDFIITATKAVKRRGKAPDIGGAKRVTEPKPKRPRPAADGNGVKTASKEQFDKGSSVAIAEAADEARKAASLREILETTRPLRVRRIKPTERPRARRKPKAKDRPRIRARAAPRARAKPKAAAKPAPVPQRAPQRRVAPLPRALPATEAQAQEQPEPQRPSPRAPAPAAVGVGTGTPVGTRIGVETPTTTPTRTRIGTETPTDVPPKKAPPRERERERGIARPPGDPLTFEGQDFSFGLPSGTFARKVVYKQGAFWVTLTLDGSDPIFTRTKPPQAPTGRTPKQTFKVVEFSERRPTQKMFDQGRSRVTVGGGGIRFRGI